GVGPTHWLAVAEVAHHLWVGAHLGVGIQVRLAQHAQDEPICFQRQARSNRAFVSGWLAFSHSSSSTGSLFPIGMCHGEPNLFLAHRVSSSFFDRARPVSNRASLRAPAAHSFAGTSFFSPEPPSFFFNPMVPPEFSIADTTLLA